MCFSATTSFGLSAILLPAAAWAIHKSATLTKGYRRIALVPLFFAIQQFCEGMVWLGVSAGDRGLTHSAALGFTFFSHLFWLAWIPFCCYSIEAPRREGKNILADDMQKLGFLGGAVAARQIVFQSSIKGKVLAGLTLLGLVHGLSMWLPLLFHESWIEVDVVHHSLHYGVNLIHEGRISLAGLQLLYLLAAVVPLFLVTDRLLNILGLIIVLSLWVSSLYFNHALISVWCYFAAVASLYLLIIIAVRAEKTG